MAFCLETNQRGLLSAPDKKGNRDNFPYYFFKMYVWDTSLELSHRDDSNEGSQHTFSMRNNKNYL